MIFTIALSYKITILSPHEYFWIKNLTYVRYSNLIKHSEPFLYTEISMQDVDVHRKITIFQRSRCFFLFIRSSSEVSRMKNASNAPYQLWRISLEKMHFCIVLLDLMHFTFGGTFPTFVFAYTFVFICMLFATISKIVSASLWYSHFYSTALLRRCGFIRWK